MRCRRKLLRLLALPVQLLSVWVLLALVVMSQETKQKAILTKDRVLGVWQTRQNKIENLYVGYRDRQSSPSRRKTAHLYVAADHHVLIDYTMDSGDPQFDERTRLITDGETSLRLTEAAHVTPRPWALFQPHGNSFFRRTLTNDAIFLSLLPFSNSVRHIEEANFNFHHYEKIHGRECGVFAAKRPSGSSALFYVENDGEHYALRRIIYNRLTIDINYRNAPDWGPLPVSWKTTRGGRVTNQGTIFEIGINQEIDPSIFAVNLSKGTLVTDATGDKVRDYILD